MLSVIGSKNEVLSLIYDAIWRYCVIKCYGRISSIKYYWLKKASVKCYRDAPITPFIQGRGTAGLPLQKLLDMYKSLCNAHYVQQNYNNIAFFP